MPATYRAVTSTITREATLELGFATLAVPVPRAGQLLIRVEAVPINPSDVGFLVGPGDVDTIEMAGTADDPVVRMALRPGALAAAADRVGQPLQVCAEGAGTVVAAGEGTQHLVGKRVALMVGRMLAEYRCIDAAHCVVLPDDVTTAEAAGLHGNPLTALGMIEAMRRDGHGGLIHSAAASNLGRILIRACAADAVPLVNIVRRPEQAAMLRALGAAYVCDSSAPGFAADLAAACGATGATLGFDATGGGRLAGDILTAIDAGVTTGPNVLRTYYGRSVRKHVYLYGRLDLSPLVIDRDFDPSWSISGWLMGPDKVGGAERYEELRQRIVGELRTTFASHFGHRLTFSNLLDPAAVRGFAKMTTGDKYMVQPSL